MRDIRDMRGIRDIHIEYKYNKVGSFRLLLIPNSSLSHRLDEPRSSYIIPQSSQHQIRWGAPLVCTHVYRIYEIYMKQEKILDALVIPRRRGQRRFMKF